MTINTKTNITNLGHLSIFLNKIPGALTEHEHSLVSSFHEKEGTIHQGSSPSDVPWGGGGKI